MLVLLEKKYLLNNSRIRKLLSYSLFFSTYPVEMSFLTTQWHLLGSDIAVKKSREVHNEKEMLVIHTSENKND